MILGGYGYGGHYGGAAHDAGYAGYGHVVPAAVLSHHNVKYYNVPSHGYVKPTTIDVPPNYIPVNFIFRSASSLINVDQKHIGAKGDYKESYSKDEPHVLKHTVTKPIIQEVHEIISPYRKVVQTVEPVKEEIKTLVARGYDKGHYGVASSGSGHSGHLYGGDHDGDHADYGHHVIDVPIGHNGIYGGHVIGHGYALGY